MRLWSTGRILAALTVAIAGLGAPAADATAQEPSTRIEGKITYGGAGEGAQAPLGKGAPTASGAALAAASTRPPGGADYNYADLTYEQCTNTTVPPQPQNPAEQLPSGWAANAFFWCRVSHVYAESRRGDRQVVGRLEFDVVSMGYAYQGERGVSFTHYVSNVRPNGDLIDGKVALSADWDRYSGKSYPTSSNGNKLKYVDMKDFGRTSIVSESYVADESIGDSSDEKVWQGKVGFDWAVAGPDSIGVAKDKYKIDVRFDSAKYLTYKSGSVFVDWFPRIEYNANDPKVKETAAHILKAQTDPANTKPEAPGKVIAGGPTGKALHRLLGSDPDALKNRAAAKKVCNQHWPNYSSQGKDCDEYPFATTQERQGGESTNYSAFPVDSQDNQEAGRRLSKFVGEMRILEGDDYYVRIETKCEKFC
ncbi:NucA/NucB deoxyribonuclease domain-containing protein [Streptomyces afghaniensis]|uniref:NucA/NucB deoxyribonuclease domain-containing protein n=1 Tax=Streptomyces afghaniensis TaxID=66865 RepID=UPI002780AFFF|nr:NucA/NucB deoxyribonuclease domain-containing protein [Streptomyces afghaniensis]MDQ1018976.1 hypothetical protein [Streptomyces afghaniensis]